MDFFFSTKFYFYSVHMSVCLHLCLCVKCQESQERNLDLLELELQMIVRSHVDAGNQTLILWRSNQCS